MATAAPTSTPPLAKAEHAESGRAYGNRQDLSQAHSHCLITTSSFTFLTFAIALSVVITQATLNHGWERTLNVSGTQSTVQWAIAHTAILSNTDQIALTAWSGVCTLYFYTAVILPRVGQIDNRLVCCGVEIAMFLFLGLAGCTILAWTMAYKWAAYAYCYQNFKLEALQVCRLAIAVIVLGWILSAVCLIGAVLEAAAVSRHGKGWRALGMSFYRLEQAARQHHDASQLAVSHAPLQSHSQPQRVPLDKDTQGSTGSAGAPTALSEKLEALEKDLLQVPERSRSGSDASTKYSASGSDVGDYGAVNTLPWAAQRALPDVHIVEVSNGYLGEEVLASASSVHERLAIFSPPGYSAHDMPLLDAQRMTPYRPGRIPVDRASGYIADGQAGRGVRSPTRFMYDHYTRPVTPPTRRASHQRSLSQANEAAAALRISRPESSHARSKSWDYI